MAREAGGNLAGINVAVCFAQAILELMSKPSCCDSLHSKAGVPQLRAIVSLHLHAVLCYPKVVIHSGHVPVCMSHASVIAVNAMC